MTDRLKVELIAHSCIRIESSSSVILCDPWFSGYAFNDGWRLEPEPDLDKVDLSRVTHIWISHEHPDHLHFPTLQAITTKVDPAKIQVLFQKTNSEKVFNALRKIGYEKFLSLDHLKPYRLDGQLEVFVYAHRQLDSCLGVIFAGKNALMNVNDTELNETDCKIILDKFGTFDVLFNQFSIAGFEGYFEPEKLEAGRLAVLDKVVEHHRRLGAKVTVPFASYMYFCKSDNFKLNEFSTTAVQAKEYLEAAGCGCVLLEPTSGACSLDELPQADATCFFSAYYEGRVLREEDVVSTTLAECSNAFSKRTSLWKSKTSPFLYRRIHDVSAYIEDLDIAVVLDFQKCELREHHGLTAQDCDLHINSQPLGQAFALPFGIQTLGVSGRYRLQGGLPQWKLVRIISSLSNAEVFLSVRGLLNRPTLQWAWARRRGLLSQVKQQAMRFS